MPDNHDNENGGQIGRRDALKVMAATAAAALSLPGCGQTAKGVLPKLTEASPEQLARRKKGRSTVALVNVASYEENIFQALKPFIAQAGLPDLKGKKVVLKPNMVEVQPGIPITTNPAVVKATIELVDYMGAREIIVAEGPGHMRDTDYLLEATGIGPMLRTMGIPFFDLNIQDIVAVPNPHNFSGLDPIWLPTTLREADAVISVPKMKTHHWVGITSSMKNLFGCYPGRKYGWPKNTLHIQGIPNCIIDINNLVKPAFAVVDAIIAMEGDGPVNGKPINTGFVVLGTDLAAVDATCARVMGYKPEEISYIARAGQVLGNIKEDDIDIVGAKLADVSRDFTKPLSYYNKQLIAESANSGS